MHDAPQRALVLDRWNSWVRVWLPELGEVRWIDLGESEFEPMDAGAGEPASESRASRT